MRYLGWGWRLDAVVVDGYDALYGVVIVVADWMWVVRSFVGCFVGSFVGFGVGYDVEFGVESVVYFGLDIFGWNILGWIFLDGCVGPLVGVNDGGSVCILFCFFSMYTYNKAHKTYQSLLSFLLSWVVRVGWLDEL